jgi:hypothetical protein
MAEMTERPLRFFADPREPVDIRTMEVVADGSSASSVRSDAPSGSSPPSVACLAVALGTDSKRVFVPEVENGTDDSRRGEKLTGGLECIDTWRLSCPPPQMSLCCCVAPELVPGAWQTLRFSAEYSSVTDGASDLQSCEFGIVLAREDDGSGISREKLYDGMLDTSGYSHSRDCILGVVFHDYTEDSRDQETCDKIPENSVVNVSLDYSRGDGLGVFSVSHGADNELVVASSLPLGAVPWIGAQCVSVTVHNAQLATAGDLIKSARKG